MSDPNPELRQTLEQLDQELKRTQPADEAQRQHLESLQNNVRSLLDSPAPTTPDQAQTTRRSMADSLRHFEATHPLLTRLTEQVLEILSNLGV